MLARFGNTAKQLARNPLEIIALFIVLVYGIVFSIGIWYINKMIEKGPQPALPGPETLPSRPLAGGRPNQEEPV